MSQANPPALAAAYAVCRTIAKREAKNFYWAFRVLPQHKSDAMCAVYAFMRKADDLADDESLSIEARRSAMADWTASWRASRTQPNADPVFLALNDTQQRFNIPDDLLAQLIAGTTMDLQSQSAGVVTLRDSAGNTEFQVYETFDALYRYCYLVASVVGLVCIRIFGYTDPRAELLAEHTGVAFQLTNILRDIREDAGRHRIYLPLDEMNAHQVTLDSLLSAVKSKAISPAIHSLLLQTIHCAQDLYKAADELIPLLDRDSQSAMNVLATIYHSLLDRIARDPDAVFRERISVPTSEKLGILGRGVIASAMTRRGA